MGWRGDRKERKEGGGGTRGGGEEAGRVTEESRPLRGRPPRPDGRIRGEDVSGDGRRARAIIVRSERQWCYELRIGPSLVQ